MDAPPLPPVPLPLTSHDLRQTWERVRENEGCAGADGVTIHEFAQPTHRRLPELLAGTPKSTPPSIL
jgi:hypothetical protein